MLIKKIVVIFLSTIAIIAFYLGGTGYQFFFVSLVNKQTTTSIKVYPHESLAAVIDRLTQQKIIHHPVLFAWLFALKCDRHLHWGEYNIQYPMSAWTLLKHMLHGTGFLKHRLTFVEGWTFSQIRAAIERNADLNQTLAAQTTSAILQKLHATHTHAEGLFYPDTYIFTWGNSDLSILKMAYQKMQKVLQYDWNNRAPHLLYQNAYQALIVASLIERETALASEKPDIASVILNRLKIHMRLQVDPTVQYGLDKAFDDVITKKDLTLKTPYNTYQVNGLPPTPICMPTESSILAALHPAQTDYLYYVANGQGGHAFSKTYAEHLKQVAAYRNETASAS